MSSLGEMFIVMLVSGIAGVVAAIYVNSVAFHKESADPPINRNGVWRVWFPITILISVILGIAVLAVGRRLLFGPDSDVGTNPAVLAAGAAIVCLVVGGGLAIMRRGHDQ